MAEHDFNADDTLLSVDSAARRHLTIAASIAGLVVYAAYLTYRGLYTINPDALIFSLLVYFAEIHGFVSLALYFFQLAHLRGRRVVAAEPGLKVDVFVTTYDEDIDLLRQTLRGAVGIRYPHQTFVLDDGRRPAVRALAEELRCKYITRQDNQHAKAGNWNNAFLQTDADLIATFDADHVPRPEFLDRTLGFFKDQKVAIVQVPQQYHDLDSVQHRVSWKSRRMFGEQDSFFNLVMPGKDNYNAAFFCGTGAVLRRKALEPHGGLLTASITEDLHTSVVLHSEGWKSVYLNERLVTGLAPVDLKSFAVQRLRWAEGNLKAATFSNPLTIPGLSLKQRVAYFASLYHWTIGVPKAIYYLAPPWMLYSGTFPIANFNRTFVLVYLAFLATLIGSYRVVSRGKGRLLMDELFNMVSFYTFIKAVKRLIFGRGKPSIFHVTSKKGSGPFDIGPVMPHMMLLAFSVLAVTWSLMGLGFGINDDARGVGIGIFWTAYNATLLGVVLHIGSRPAQQRSISRFRANFAVEARSEHSDARHVGVTADISEQGCSLLWPEHLKTGLHLPVRVHLGARSADWMIEVMSDLGRESDGWHRHGVRFLNLTPDDADLISDTIFSIVVPDLYSTLSQPSLTAQAWQRLKLRISDVAKSRARRQSVRVPVRVQNSGAMFVSTVRDLSATGLAVQSPISLAVGSEVSIAMYIPEKEWRGTATVVRVEPRPSRAGFDTWVLGLRFEKEQSATDVEQFRRWDAA